MKIIINHLIIIKQLIKKIILWIQWIYWKIEMFLNVKLSLVIIIWIMI
jgi:hypothetical protein